MNWETGTEVYTLLYIKQIRNKDPLYSAENSIQHSVMVYGEKILKEWKYVEKSNNASHLAVSNTLQEYWNGWPFPSPGDLLDPWIELRSPVLQADSLPSEPPWKPPGYMFS